MPVLPQYWLEYEARFPYEIPVNPNEVRFVVLDTETTGFDYQKDRILSIGALVLQKNEIKVRDSFSVFLRQEIHSAETVKIHGILKNGNLNYVPEPEALQHFLVFLGNAIIVAHHALFDIRMINTALERQGLPKLKNQYLDTCTLYKKTRLRSNLIKQQENYTLDELADKFNVPKKDRHTALGDAYITAILFLKILSKLKEKREVTLKWLLG
ncbi:MAG: 3'-5' exonuclease [Bacteroidota bacterium]